MKAIIKKLWKDESAQGMSEYMLLLVIIVGILIIFKDKIRGIVQGKMDDLGGQIGGFNGN